MSQPTLYIVSTPIGNLSDFSIHAQHILSSVSFILCEDTRHTLKLLNHFNIKNKLESLHVHNEKNKLDYLIDKLLNSDTHSAALVSDAGTPAICDPGSYLVAAAHEKNIQIIIVPGPCSMTSALAASGFIQPRSLFSGFLSKNKSMREKSSQCRTSYALIEAFRIFSAIAFGNIAGTSIRTASGSTYFASKV